MVKSFVTRHIGKHENSGYEQVVRIKKIKNRNYG